MSKSDAVATLFPRGEDRVGRPWISKSDLVDMIDVVYDDMAEATSDIPPHRGTRFLLIGA